MGKKSTMILSPVLATNQIDRINIRLKEELNILNKEAETLLGGKLFIRYRNNHIQFNKRENGKVNGITRFPETVYQIARRQYLNLYTDLLEQILEEGWTEETTQIIKRIYPAIDKLLKEFEDAGLDTELITMTPNQRIWNSNRQSQKENRKEDLIYPTKGGIYMRTKSERYIGNILEELHIPYRYETRIIINNRAYHPDFVIMLPNGRLVILEHCGRMDLKEYDESLIIRLQAYDSADIMLGRDVFITFEFDVRDENKVKEVLHQMMMADSPRSRTLETAARRAGCNIAGQ